VPWANAGGSTRLLWSDGAGERRISIAQLDRPAAFSLFPGMARLLFVLDPIMIELDVCGIPTTVRRYERLRFSGSDPVALRAVDRPGRVLNLICRADRWASGIDHVGADPDRIGWMVLQDDGDLRSGDLILGPEGPPQSLPIRFAPAATPAESR